MSHDRRPATEHQLSRRQLLVTGGRIGLAGVAGAGSVMAVRGAVAVRAQTTTVASAALVTTRPAGDRGAIDDLVAALDRAGSDLDLATSVLTVADPAAQEAAIRRLAQAGTDIIAATFEAADGPLGTVAAEFPGTRFIGIGGGAGAPPSPNLVTVTFDTYLGAYLAGVLCAHATVTRQLAYLGGLAGPAANASANAFAEAAADVDDAIVVTPGSSGSDTDADAGRLAADRIYAAGADLLLTDAGAADLGAIDAALAAQGYIVGASGSVVELAPASVVATLAVLHGDALYEQLRSALDAGFTGGHIRSGIADGMIDLIVSDRFLAEGPPGMAERIGYAVGPMDEARQAIIAGTLVPRYRPLPPA